jgi:hypothetical protein
VGCRLLVSGALVVAALVVAPSAYAASAPVRIGSNSTSFPTQSAVAVDSTGTAYIAWGVGSPQTQMDFCKVPVGASGCTPVVLPAPAGGTLFDPPSVLVSGPDVFVFEESISGSDTHTNGINVWTSVDGGSSFTLNPTAVGFVPGNATPTNNPVIALPGSNIGMGWVVPGNNPDFQANSLTSPSDFSSGSYGSSPASDPFATLNPSPNNYSVGNLGGQFAAQLTGTQGILGVVTLIEAGPCPNSEGLVYSFASLPATNDVLNTNGAWSPLGGVDCNTYSPAVGGGPAGLGLLETNDASLSAQIVQYRRFTPPSTFSAPVTVAHGVGLHPSVSQDGAGGIYATWLDGDTGLNLAYSSTGGSSWTVKTLLSNNGGQTTLDSLASSVNAAGRGWAAFAANGVEYAQPFDKTAVLPPPPGNTKPPKLGGTPKAGKTLSCSTGSWSNKPTVYGYQWYRNGVPLAGATGRTYKVQTLDEGATLTCVVTAANAGGFTSATSNADKVPIPFVAHCPGATGKLSGTTLGLVKLGMTKARAHYLYRFHSDRGKQYEDFFCLTPIGVRVGYASPKLLDSLANHERKQLAGRVVWSSTSNPFYALNRVRAGEKVTVAAARLKLEPPFHIGLNYWYLARTATATAVLKVRGGVVQEIGIADNALTTTRKAQGKLMASFY